MLRCIIVDDEPVAIDILVDYVSRTEYIDLEGTFRNAIKALEHVRTHPVDLIFLDINMPDLSGIDFLKSMDSRPLVIFTTAYSEFAAKSYDFEAVDYLVKPIEFERFLKAAGRALNRFNGTPGGRRDDPRKDRPKAEDSIMVKSGTDYHRLELGRILYIESRGNYVTFVMPGKEVTSLTTLKEILDKLPGGRFVRIHRSFVIAFDKIDVVRKDSVIIRDTEIPIGEVYRGELKKRMGSGW